jgi:hypothetical protein
MAQGAESKKDFVHKVGIVLRGETKIKQEIANLKSQLTILKSQGAP